MIAFVFKIIVIGTIAGLILVFIISLYSYKKDKSNKTFKSYKRPDEADNVTFNFSDNTKLFSSENNEKAWKNIEQKEINAVKPTKITITAELTSAASQDDDPVGILTHIDLGKPETELGCYLNYYHYKIIGIDEDGNSKLRLRSGINEQLAIKKVESLGLRPPFKISTVKYDAATERQLAYLGSLGVVIPDFITKDDASYMISRVIDDDLEGPNSEIVDLALALNIEFSAFIGANSLFDSIIEQACDRDRAALFAYGVHQNIKHLKWSNMLNDPNVSKFYDFADFVISDAALLKSLKGREPYDYICQHKGTKIYKAAVSFFNL